MSSIVTNQGIVHYEAYGRGQPVILLHGWLGSWGYWLRTMETLKRQYRCYALDFWGFGDSGKRRSSYQVTDFVDLVDQFMERLGIDAAPIVGHSMGGTVAVCLALTKPERVKRVIVVDSPIAGNSLNIFLRLAGKPWVANIVWHLPVMLKFGIKLFSPFIVKDWPNWYQMITRDLSSTTLEAFFSSINSLHQTDLSVELPNVNTPIMGIYGVGDNVVAPSQANVIMKNAWVPRIKVMKDCKHFPMLDAPQAFNSTLADFLAWEFTPPV
ncbi:alpha/beta hydrolase [Anaerolineales bacterium HSG24]|nr:alpha/beta hydrolase [Anaerolineales bacterium HSG24]